MKRLSKIDESVWADIHKRSNGEIIRKEDGIKVHTCLGVDMVIKSKNCKYDEIIQDIMNHGNLMVSQMDSIDDLTADEREEIRNWENPYFYLISGNESYDSDELVATFIKYDDLVAAELIESKNEVYEEDYIAMCRCISTKVREIANYLEFIPMYNNAKMHSHYYGSYHPFLAKVPKKLDKDELTHFTEELEKQFPELDGIDLIYWYKYDETYLALPISFVTVMNLKDYIKFTKEWFSLNESVWADMHKRSNGDQVRKEDDVDILDAQGFVEYLRNIYENVNTDFYIYKDLNDLITVPIFETELGTKATWFILYNCPDNSVLIWDYFLNKDDKLFDKIKRKYNVKKYYINRNFTDNFVITPKTGKSSNKFFIEIIDFLLENASVFFTRILVKKDNMNESVWADIHKRSNGSMFRKEDLPEQDPEHWWTIIPLPQAPKYTKEQLRGLDIAYEFVINKIRKITKDDWPEKVDIYFKNEHYWRLQIEHITPYGSDTYTLNINGGRSYTPITWSKMTLGDKRGIRYRLENKTFYLYKYNLYGSKKGYILREDPEYEGEKGILLK